MSTVQVRLYIFVIPTRSCSERISEAKTGRKVSKHCGMPECQIYLLIQSNLLTLVLDGGLLATGSAGYTSFIQLLQKTGANCNIHDDLGGLPIEIVAMYECKKEVELLLP